MFGFGSKFNSRSLNSFGKCVADYLHSSGEIVLIRNPVDGIPLTHEIEEDNSSHKQIKAMTRFMFDCGAIWCMAYVCLRDEEYKNLNEAEAVAKTENEIGKFIEQGLKCVSKYDYDLPEIYQNHKTIIDFEVDARVGGEGSPFNKGVSFGGFFLKEFYKMKFDG